MVKNYCKYGKLNGTFMHVPKYYYNVFLKSLSKSPISKNHVSTWLYPDIDMNFLSYALLLDSVRKIWMHAWFL